MKRTFSFILNIFMIFAFINMPAFAFCDFILDTPNKKILKNNEIEIIPMLKTDENVEFSEFKISINYDFSKFKYKSVSSLDERIDSKRFSVNKTKTKNKIFVTYKCRRGCKINILKEEQFRLFSISFDSLDSVGSSEFGIEIEKFEDLVLENGSSLGSLEIEIVENLDTYDFVNEFDSTEYIKKEFCEDKKSSNVYDKKDGINEEKAQKVAVFVQTSESEFKTSAKSRKASSLNSTQTKLENLYEISKNSNGLKNIKKGGKTTVFKEKKKRHIKFEKPVENNHLFKLKELKKTVKGKKVPAKTSFRVSENPNKNKKVVAKINTKPQRVSSKKSSDQNAKKESQKESRRRKKENILSCSTGKSSCNKCEDSNLSNHSFNAPLEKQDSKNLGLVASFVAVVGMLFYYLSKVNFFTKT